MAEGAGRSANHAIYIILCELQLIDQLAQPPWCCRERQSRSRSRAVLTQPVAAGTYDPAAAAVRSASRPIVCAPQLRGRRAGAGRDSCRFTIASAAGSRVLAVEMRGTQRCAAGGGPLDPTASECTRRHGSADLTGKKN